MNTNGEPVEIQTSFTISGLEGILKNQTGVSTSTRSSREFSIAHLSLLLLSIGLHHSLKMPCRVGRNKESWVFYDDHTEAHPTDDASSFFARGRDFESRYENHKYTEQERDVLASYESVDYLPPHSHVYRNWLRQQPSRYE